MWDMKKALLTTALLLVLLASYESYRVWVAHEKTPRLLQQYKQENLSLKAENLSNEQMDIILMVEDHGFYNHNGLDFSSPGQGMTTITQGLTKYMYFEKFNPGFAKLEQSLIAWLVLNKNFSKQHQLEIMLNHAYLGKNNDQKIRGFEQAAAVYFGKPFAELDEQEFLGLVGMLIGPDNLHPQKNKSQYEQRVARIKNMLSGKCSPTGVYDPYYEACG